jgi:hypothetical protein
VRIIDAQSRMAFVKELGGPGLIRQPAAWQIPPEIAAERRAADFDAARHSVAGRVHALFGLRGVPQSGKVRATVRQARRRRREVWFSVGFPRDTFCLMANPLT